MKKKIAVLLIAYNRSKFLHNTLKSLESNSGFQRFDFYLFCDGPKNDFDKIQIIKIKYLIKNFEKKNKIKIKKKFRKRNIGLYANIKNSIDETFENHHSAIILEDDIVTNPFFLNYMYKSLNFHQNNLSVGSISAYSPIKKKYLKKFQFDTFSSYRHFSWGWATWKNRWSKINWDKSYLKKLSKNKFLMYRFGQITNDLPILLKLQVSKQINTWDIILNINFFLKKMKCVFPKYSLIKNIGLTNGTHVHGPYIVNEICENWSPQKLTNAEISSEIILLIKKNIEGYLIDKIFNKLKLLKKLFKY